MTRVVRGWLVAMVAAAIGSACGRGPRTSVDAGPFSITRTQHTYSNWNTGSNTTYYTYDVTYRRRAFDFAGLSSGGSEANRPIRLESSRIAYVFVVAEAPAALLVVSGDPNNDASWNLLVDTPDGLRAEHVAYYGSYAELAWLDGDVPQDVKRPWEDLELASGRWLWVGQQALLDRSSLRVHSLSSPSFSRDGAAFVAFSPDRARMARLTSLTDPEDFRKWRSIVLVNDIATGEARQLPIDPASMWFDDSRDIDREWLDTYFEWRRTPHHGYTLQQRATAKPRPYRGRSSIASLSGAAQYHVPRIAFAKRGAVMDFIAAAMNATYTMEDPLPTSPPPAATAPGDSARDASARTDAMSAPITDTVVRADLDLKGQHLAIYFSDRGLSIDNDDAMRNEIVGRIAAAMDQQLATPAGLAWIANPPSGL